MNEDKNTFKPADFSDAGNAAVFVREHCDDIIFTDSMGWLCWDGKRWERNEHKALELAEDFSEHMLRDAMGEYRDALHNEAEAKAADPEGSEAVKAASEAVKRSKAYLAHANMTRRVSRLKAILDLAQTVYGPPRQFHGCGSAGAEHTGWDYQPGNGRLSAKPAGSILHESYRFQQE